MPAGGVTRYLPPLHMSARDACARISWTARRKDPMRVRCAAAGLALAGLLTISCGGIVDPSKNQIEPFSGTLNPQGFVPHPFSVSKTGEISIRVTALAPLNNIPIGIIWAQASGTGACDGGVIQSAAGNLNGPPAISGQIFSGNYCALVYDLGILTGPETYTITVSHP
jgi:hypothetical protein